MEIISPNITAVPQYTPPLHWKAQLARGASIGLAISGIAAALYTRDVGYVVVGCTPALLGLMWVLKHSNDAKQQPRTDADVHAVVGANAIQCTPKWGIYNKMVVIIRGTRPPEHETAHWSDRAAAELQKQLLRGFCEISDLQPTAAANVFTAHISVRLPYPGKDGHHQHIDLAHHMLRHGLLVIDRSEAVTQVSERCVMEAKKKGRGVWGYLK